MRKINLLVIHHSETGGGNVEFIRYCHTAKPPDGFGWNDVGYHFVIGNGKPNGGWKKSEDGKIEIGRPESAIGAHAKGFNSNSLGICLIGDFDKTNPTDNQLCSLVKLLVELCDAYGVDPLTQIKGHGELMPTLCPGANLQRLMPIISDCVNNTMNGNNPIISILKLVSKQAT